MRLISTLECKPGMKLGKPVYSSTGQKLVANQMELTESIIARLNGMGYEYLYIDDPSTEGIFIEDSIRIETRMALRLSLERLLNQLSIHPVALLDGRLSVYNLCWESISMVMNDLKNPRDDTIMLIQVGSPSKGSAIGHFIQNAIDVCVFATKIGISQGYYGKDLMALSLGALLHDIGNFRLSQDVLLKPGALTEGEFNHIKQHSELGFELLKNEPGIPASAALCALMHHERINGSGYPNGLKGEEIHPFARWVGLIDAYDAMTNPRPYRKALLPNVAMEILYAGAGTLYDLDKVELFRKKLAIFPVGLPVLLSTGEQGIVARINRDFIQRPVVRVLKDPNGVAIRQPYEIDLSQKLNIMIDQIGESVAK